MHLYKILKLNPS